MKKMSIRINVLNMRDVDFVSSVTTTETLGTTSANSKSGEYQLGNYTEIPVETAITEKRNIATNYIIKGVGSCTISDTYDNLTQTASFKLPIKDTIIYRDRVIAGRFTRGYILFKNESRLYVGSQVMINMGYDDNLQTRFIGYIKEFKEEKDYINIMLEDSMYMLKHSISMQKNFPKVIGDNTFDTDTYDGENFNLTHLVYWMLENIFTKSIEENRQIVIPRTRTYSTELGKVVMKDALTPAEIMQYYLKKVFGMKAFFRNEYVDPDIDRSVSEHSYLMEPVLYIGWSNWNYQPFEEFILNFKGIHQVGPTKVDRYVNTKSLAKDSDADVSQVVTTDSQLGLTDFVYSYTFKFMYPYDADYITKSGNKYNPMVSHNLEWYNTDKDNLKITATSFNPATQTTNKLIYQYGKYHVTNDLALKAEKLKKKEYIKSLTKAEKVEYNASLNNVTTIKDSNNLQTFNEITLNYPNLDEESLKLKIEEYYEAYPQSGLKGSFVAFGEPYIRQGDKVQLRIDQSHNPNIKNIVKNSNDDGFITYYVKRVDTTFTMDGGIRQNITIDKIA